jgi:hypothetical protein
MLSRQAGLTSINPWTLTQDKQLAISPQPSQAYHLVEYASCGLALMSRTGWLVTPHS